MTNEIHPFDINISISKALKVNILKLGIQNNVYAFNADNVKLTVIEILTDKQCLCTGSNTTIYTVFDNLKIFINISVVLYNKVKYLKFVEQPKLFEDEKQD